MKHFNSSFQYQRKKRRGGNVIVLMALSTVVLLGMIGLSIDGGHLYVERRQMQNAADAGAYAGGYLMAKGTTEDTAVLAAVHDYASRNGLVSPSTNVHAWYTKAGVRIGVELPGNGSAPEGTDGIEVVTSITYPTYFIRALGISHAQALGIAGARATPPATNGGGGGAAVFAGNKQRSDAIKTTGPDYTIVGTVHSNAGITNSGGGYHVTGEVEYVTGTTSVDRWTIDSATDKPVQSTIQPYPVNFQLSDFAPGSAEAQKAGALYHDVAGDMTLNGVIPSGLYYVHGNVKGSSKFSADKVTIVSEGTIDISSPESFLTAFTQNLALFTTAMGSALHISSGGSSAWTGRMFAPNGAINFSMPNGTMVGGLIGDTIDITGPNANINGGSGGPGGPGDPGQVFLYK